MTSLLRHIRNYDIIITKKNCHFSFPSPNTFYNNPPMKTKKGSRKPKAIWTEDAEIALLSKVIEVNPFAAGFGKTKEAWESVAANLTVENGVDGTTCYAKVTSIIAKYSLEELKHLKETVVTNNDEGECADELLVKEKLVADVAIMIDEVKVQKTKKDKVEKDKVDLQEKLRSDATKRIGEKECNGKETQV